MPIYKNKTNVTQFASGVKFDPNEQKEVICYLYNKNLELISEEPIPLVITHSGSFEMATDEETIIELSGVVAEECLLDVVIQVPDGGVLLYHNSKNNFPIKFEGVCQDQISSKFLKSLIIKATKDGVKGSYFIKKVS